MSRRGYGLIELLIALSLTGVVALLAWTLLRTSAFRLRERSERLGLEHSLRVAWSASRALVEPLGRDSTAGADLALVAPDAVTARAVRAAGVLCDAGPDSLVARDASGWWLAVRAPSAGRDSLMTGSVTGAERWAVSSLDAAPRVGRCPDGSPAMVLPARLQPADLAAVGAGSPVRVFEPVELRAYTSAGADWVGMRSASGGGSIQPLAGPFPGGGVRFGFFSLAGSTVGAPGQVARIGLDIVGLTERALGVGVARAAPVRADSATSAVLLRNSP